MFLVTSVTEYKRNRKIFMWCNNGSLNVINILFTCVLVKVFLWLFCMVPVLYSTALIGSHSQKKVGDPWAIGLSDPLTELTEIHQQSKYPWLEQILGSSRSSAWLAQQFMERSMTIRPHFKSHIMPVIIFSFSVLSLRLVTNLLNDPDTESRPTVQICKIYTILKNTI